jgi:hypothetical protein
MTDGDSFKLYKPWKLLLQFILMMLEPIFGVRYIFFLSLPMFKKMYGV